MSVRLLSACLWGYCQHWWFRFRFQCLLIKCSWWCWPHSSSCLHHNDHMKTHLLMCSHVQFVTFASKIKSSMVLHVPCPPAADDMILLAFAWIHAHTAWHCMESRQTCKEASNVCAHCRDSVSLTLVYYCNMTIKSLYLNSTTVCKVDAQLETLFWFHASGSGMSPQALTHCYWADSASETA